MAHCLPQMSQGVTRLFSTFQSYNHSARMNVVKMYGSDSHFGLVNMAEHKTEQAARNGCTLDLLWGGSWSDLDGDVTIPTVVFMISPFLPTKCWKIP